MDKKLDISQQCAAQKTNCILGYISRGVRRGTERIVPLCCALMRPHLQHCIQGCSPQQKKDEELLKGVYRRAGESLLKDSMRELGSFSLERNSVRPNCSLPVLKGIL